MRFYRVIALGLVLSLCATLFPSPTHTQAEAQIEVRFTDIRNHRYEESIRFLAERGIVEGFSTFQFGPEAKLNRAQMMKIVMLAALGEAEVSEGRDCFKDVKDEWFARYVCSGKEKGFVQGYDTGFYEPAKEVNMVEAEKMALESFGISPERSEGQEWFEPYLEFTHQHSLFSKYSYFPARSMTRGEMSFLVHQLILEKEGTQKLAAQAQFWSEGCGKTPPTVPPSQSIVRGVNRSYITVIPEGYKPNVPTKLVFAFHGRTNSNSMVRGYYKVEEAAKGQAIFVYPSGLPTETSPRNWSDGGDSASNIRDYALFDQLLDEFSHNYCLDLDEVYVVGHSLGAWFTNSLACFRGDVIRAVGTLGGGTSIGDCAGPVAVMIWHNPKDNLAPFTSGLQARDQYLRQNQCSQKTIPTSPSEGNCVEYQGCFDDAPVIWCPHTIDTDYRGNYYPHTWPNFTGKSIWSFFESLE